MIDMNDYNKKKNIITVIVTLISIILCILSLFIKIHTLIHLFILYFIYGISKFIYVYAIMKLEDTYWNGENNNDNNT